MKIASNNLAQTKVKSLHLGQDQQGQAIELPFKAFSRHAICLGSSGSGKTVACKVITEEFLLAGLPVIAVDPQGDIASMLQVADLPYEAAASQKQILARQKRDHFQQQVEVVVWTPSSQAGVALCLDPLRLDDLPHRPAERIRMLSSIASSLCGLLGYQSDRSDGTYITAYLDLLLQYLTKQKNNPVRDLKSFSDFLDNLPPALHDRTARVITENKRQEVHRKIEILGIGVKSLLFQMGTPLEIDTLLGLREPKSKTTRLSIIYLNSLHSQEEKDFFVNQLVQALYHWMLDHPSPRPQALFYIDEIAPFLPPVRKPASKDSLKLLFKQARKYGISCLIASQNPGDIDYTALSQFSTWMIGRMMLQQDLKKIEPFLRAMAPSTVNSLLSQIPTLEPGELLLLNPDFFSKPELIFIRQLLTKHETIDESGIEKLLPKHIRDLFEAVKQEQKDPEQPKTSPSSVPKSFPVPTQLSQFNKDTYEEQAQETSSLQILSPREQAKSIEEDERKQLIQLREKINAQKEQGSSTPLISKEVAENLKKGLKSSLSSLSSLSSKFIKTTYQFIQEGIEEQKAASLLDDGPPQALFAPPKEQEKLSNKEDLEVIKEDESLLENYQAQHPKQIEALEHALKQQSLSGKITLANTIEQYLSQHPGAYTTKELSQHLQASEASLRNAFKKLREQEKASAQRVGRSHYHWLSPHAFSPISGITTPLQMASMHVHVERAYIVAERASRGVFFNLIRFENIKEPVVKHLLAWKVLIRVTTSQKDFHQGQEDVIPAYFEARSGQLLHIHEEQFQFIKHANQFNGQPENLGHYAQFTAKSPGELGIGTMDLLTLQTQAEILSRGHRFFDILEEEPELIAIPYWHFVLSGVGKKRRSISIDGLFGKILHLPFDDNF